MGKIFSPLLSFLITACLTVVVSYYYYNEETNQNRLDFSVTECLANNQIPGNNKPIPSFNTQHNTLTVDITESVACSGKIIAGGFTENTDTLTLKEYYLPCGKTCNGCYCSKTLTYQISDMPYPYNYYETQKKNADIFLQAGYQVSEIVKSLNTNRRWESHFFKFLPGLLQTKENL